MADAKLQVVLPEKKYRYKCAIPGCDARFNSTGNYRRHVVRCADEHDPLIQAHLAEKEANVFTGINDKEQYRWLKDRKDS